MLDDSNLARIFCKLNHWPKRMKQFKVCHSHVCFSTRLPCNLFVLIYAQNKNNTEIFLSSQMHLTLVEAFKRNNLSLKMSHCSQYSVRCTQGIKTFCTKNKFLKMQSMYLNIPTAFAVKLRSEKRKKL